MLYFNETSLLNIALGLTFGPPPTIEREEREALSE